MQAHLYGQAQGDDVGHPGQAHSVTTWGTLHALAAYLNPRQDTFITEKAAGPQPAQPSANGCGNHEYMAGLPAEPGATKTRQQEDSLKTAAYTLPTS